jgi:hypothetical protein
MFASATARRRPENGLTLVLSVGVIDATIDRGLLRRTREDDRRRRVDELQIVEVRTDDFVRGIARREYWAAAAAPEQALMLVLAAVPEGWTVSLSDVPGHGMMKVGLRLQPGEARLIR